MTGNPCTEYFYKIVYIYFIFFTFKNNKAGQDFVSIPSQKCRIYKFWMEKISSTLSE